MSYWTDDDEDPGGVREQVVNGCVLLACLAWTLALVYVFGLLGR